MAWLLEIQKREIESLKQKTYPNNGIQVLGVNFKNDTAASNIDSNWENKIIKCENIMKMWSKVKVNNYGENNTS